MIGAMEVREEDESFKNVVDLMFDRLEAKDQDHFAVRQYRKFKLAAGGGNFAATERRGANLEGRFARNLRTISALPLMSWLGR